MTPLQNNVLYVVASFHRIKKDPAILDDFFRTASRPKQRPEPFLLKMPVIREHVRKPFPAHRLHRDAIRQAVAFVRPSLVETQPFEKALAALRNNAHTVDRKKTPDGNHRILSQAFTRGAEGQHLSKHFIRGDEDAPTRAGNASTVSWLASFR